METFLFLFTENSIDNKNLFNCKGRICLLQLKSILVLWSEILSKNTGSQIHGHFLLHAVHEICYSFYNTRVSLKIQDWLSSPEWKAVTFMHSQTVLHMTWWRKLYILILTFWMCGLNSLVWPAGTSKGQNFG